MRSPHENAIHRARFDAQRAEHTFRVVNREAGYLESLSVLDSLLSNINAIHRTCFSALVTCDARRQVIAVETPITSSDRHRLFRVFKLVREGTAFFIVRDQPIAKRDPEPVSYGDHRIANVANPIKHRLFIPTAGQYLEL